MKPFSIWAVITLIVFGAFSGGYHLYLTENPRKVLVAVDSSFPMKSVWRQVPRVLDNIDNQRYAEFTLLTGKNRIHSWLPRLELGTVVPYAPRDLSRLTDKGNYLELDEATEKYLVTNAAPSETANFDGWHIIQPSR